MGLGWLFIGMVLLGRERGWEVGIVRMRMGLMDLYFVFWWSCAPLATGHISSNKLASHGDTADATLSSRIAHN